MNQELIIRYQEGYRAAASAIHFGNGIRAFGLLLGTAIVIMGFSAGAGGDLRTMGWLLGGGVLAALALASIGMFIGVQGRLLRGTLDTSAMSNPMLTPHERSRAIERV
jgi:hypothetical protein